MTGPATVPSGYSALYITDAIPDNTDAKTLRTSLNWTATPMDWKSVTGV